MMVRRNALAIPGRKQGERHFPERLPAPGPQGKACFFQGWVDRLNHAGDDQERHRGKGKGLGESQAREAEDSAGLEPQELARNEPLKTEKEDDGHSNDKGRSDDGEQRKCPQNKP